MNLEPLWESENSQEDVPINACVWVAAKLPFRKAEQLLWSCQEVHGKKTGHYFVFMTTDTSKTARQIINTYELRPEIEEDFRQMKDFWK